MAAVPKSPGLYAMYGGLSPRTWVAYVGEAGNLAQRLNQHLFRRDSSVTTGVQAVSLNVDHVAHVAWWLHPSFSDENKREAAELIAFRILDPALRSRGGVSQKGQDLAQDQSYSAEMRALLQGPPAGVYQPPRLSDVADRLARIEERLSNLEGIEQST